MESERYISIYYYLVLYFVCCFWLFLILGRSMSCEGFKSMAVAV
jgi:hypothetical protein